MRDICEKTLTVSSGIAVSESLLHPMHHDRMNIERTSDAFILILSGECRYTFQNGNTFTAKKGDILYLANRSRYIMDIPQSSPEYSVPWVDFFFDTEENCESAVCQSPDRAKCEMILRRLMVLYGRDKSLDGAEARSLIYSIYAAFQSSKEQQYLSGLVKKRLDAAYDYIVNRYSDPTLRISDPARIAEMSEVYFRKNFLRRYGMTPIEFLMFFRVSQAKIRLMSGLQSLEEISEQCGFSSVPYFYRVFRKVTGMTPGDFRKKK